MTHPMRAVVCRPVKDFSEFTSAEREMIARELDRLHAIEQEARKNFMTADGKVVLDPYQTVYKVSVYPDCANPLGFIGGHPAYQAIYNDSSLAGYYSTVEAAEAALAAAKGTT